MVRRLAFAVPGDLATPTGGYAYDRRIIAELKELGWQVDVVGLGDGFPRPSAEQRAFAQARLAEVTKGTPIVIDGLAFGVLPEAARALYRDYPLVGLVHHPLALETGLSSADAAAMKASEKHALAATQAVIATSDLTGRLLAQDYDVPFGRITVAPPGTDRVTPRAAKAGETVRLLSIGSIVPRKGYDVLVAALATLADLPWHLSIAGDRTRNVDAAARLDADIARYNLGSRIDVLGAVSDDRIAKLYSQSDAFVLASRFEGYGMVFTEALAHGLPVIGTTGGAIPETVPKDAGMLVPPDDAAALAKALREIITSAEKRERLAAAARASGARLPTWRDSANLFAKAIEAVA
ncbi:MAG: glycosyltransferase family 4 protein [Pseudomonadota bacterium]